MTVDLNGVLEILIDNPGTYCIVTDCDLCHLQRMPEAKESASRTKTMASYWYVCDATQSQEVDSRHANT